ncbi:MAG: nucleotidyl transferase AbiEii/AbiGii toxin family protein [Chloroflexi bacterium]|nr:nucleotidyl transferase AbiEii/AbiGii toxin family protein [Chloroflexota bacterium]
MISLGELRRASARLGLGLAQAEHEYALLCALDGLAQTTPLNETFCLKGGTALRQFYFPDWRHSVDLDFTVLPSFPKPTLREGLERWFERIEALHGLRVRLLHCHRPNGSARVRAQFLGPLGHPSRLLLDITLDETVLLPPERRPVLTGLFAQPAPQVLTYALEEILAEKLRAILERGKARDYYDVWRLLEEKSAAFDSATVYTTLLAKCAHKGLPQPAIEHFFLAPMLEQAQAYWVNDLADQVKPHSLPPWRQVVADLQPLLANLLGGKRDLS